jgi:hypothetical protein
LLPKTPKPLIIRVKEIIFILWNGIKFFSKLKIMNLGVPIITEIFLYFFKMGIVSPLKELSLISKLLLSKKWMIG